MLDFGAAAAVAFGTGALVRLGAGFLEGLRALEAAGDFPVLPFLLALFPVLPLGTAGAGAAAFFAFVEESALGAGALFVTGVLGDFVALAGTVLAFTDGVLFFATVAAGLAFFWGTFLDEALEGEDAGIEGELLELGLVAVAFFGGTGTRAAGLAVFGETVCGFLVGIPWVWRCGFS